MVRGSYLGGSINNEHRRCKDHPQERRETRPTSKAAKLRPSPRISGVPFLRLAPAMSKIGSRIDFPHPFQRRNPFSPGNQSRVLSMTHIRKDEWL